MGHVSLNNFTFHECMCKKMSSAGTRVTNLEVDGEESRLFVVCIQLSEKRVVSSCMLIVVLCGIIYINYIINYNLYKLKCVTFKYISQKMWTLACSRAVIM